MSYFIDVQGTLLDDKDKSLINGSKELVNYFNNNKIPYVVITNNTKFKSEIFLNKLRNKGLDIKDEHYLDPFMVLDSILKPCNVAMFGADEFIETMRSMGFTQDFKSPNAVLIASHTNFKFDDFALMIELIQKGVKFIPFHATSIYKKNDRLYPGVGAIAQMIKNATTCDFEVIGKPSKSFYLEGLRLLNLQKNNQSFKDIIIVSDDAKGDLFGAKDIGMNTALVLSGKTKDTKVLGAQKDKIDYIFKDVCAFLGEIVEKN